MTTAAPAEKGERKDDQSGKGKEDLKHSKEKGERKEKDSNRMPWDRSARVSTNIRARGKGKGK